MLLAASGLYLSFSLRALPNHVLSIVRLSFIQLAVGNYILLSLRRISFVTFKWLLCANSLTRGQGPLRRTITQFKVNRKRRNEKSKPKCNQWGMRSHHQFPTNRYPSGTWTRDLFTRSSVTSIPISIRCCASKALITHPTGQTIALTTNIDPNPFARRRT